ncbi:MAG: hypothetical protein LBC88_09590 [Spirochaetaceae bacterium]|jgi:hypothetical protein|nr:hypothetical protein [Spirochaetaceae bacterium]
MQTFRRTQFSLIRGIIAAPFSGVLVYILGQIFLPVWLSAIAGAAAAGALVYMAVFSENIYCELDDTGAFRFFRRGVLKNSFDLTVCRIGYRRKTEWGLFGNNDIRLHIIDGQNGETFLDVSPLGTARFNELFAAMEKHAAGETEVLNAGKQITGA